MGRDPAEKLLLQLWAEKKQGKKCRKDFLKDYTILLALESQCMLWKECMSWKLVRLFQSSFNFLASLKSGLQKSFMLLLGLAHSPSFQTHPGTNLHFGAYVGISATGVVFPSTVKASFHVFQKLTYTSLLTFQ